MAPIFYCFYQVVNRSEMSVTVLDSHHRKYPAVTGRMVAYLTEEGIRWGHKGAWTVVPTPSVRISIRHILTVISTVDHTPVRALI